MQPTKNTRNQAGLSSRVPGMTPGNRKATPHSSSAPSLLGIWRLGQPLYNGQHSRLFAAQPADADGSPRFDYVLRTVCESREHREDAVAQLNRFATAAAMVKHPNLIAVLDVSLQSAHPFLIMPRLLGATLAQWIRGAALQPLPVILWAVRQAAQGLAALHAASWAHGDIKPDNLFMSQQGHLTLLDLGFARQIGTSTRSLFLGTPKYAAPELTADEPPPVLAASDVYALGKVLLELLAWTAPSVRNPAVIDPVADLISEMIADRPGSRPTAEDVAARSLRLEIETLGEHFQPAGMTSRLAA